MVVNKLIENLMYTGLGEYEARVYVALLERSPATAYEVAKAAGIPTSKVYEVVARLTERGVLTQMESSGKTKYAPQDPKDFIHMRRHMMESTLKWIDDDISSLGRERTASVVWNLGGRNEVMEKAVSMIDSARLTLLLSLWEDEYAGLLAPLGRAAGRGVRIATLHYGNAVDKVGLVYPHPVRHTEFQERGGRSMVVVSDSGEALVGTIRRSPDGEDLSDAAYGTSPGFVALAADYVKHDIYMIKVVSRFDWVLRDRFGPEYEKLRDVFTDDELE